jgi:putative ABC transport system ATP-binding protein
MIEVKHVWKKYNPGMKNEVIALKDINLKIERGEFIFISGPSGCGKSTLMHIIGCLDTPTRGEVYMDDVKVSSLNDGELSKIRRDKIGFVFQAFNLIPSLNAMENVMLPMILVATNKEELRNQAKTLLEAVGLGHRLKHKPNQLSGGEQQRVTIARAMLNNPEVILADEPTGELDSKTGEGILKLLKKVNKEKGTTVVAVSHNMLTKKYCDRHLKLKDGKIVR